MLYLYVKRNFMEINWIIIVAVAIVVLGLIVYLIRQNQKDEKEVTRFFNTDISELNEEEDELNNLR